MRNLFLSLCLSACALFTSTAAVAQDSGVYFNPEADGEGIVLIRNGDLFVTYLFTYGEDICGLPVPPVVSPEPEVVEGEGCVGNGQRWFVGADEATGDFVTGFLYVTDGIDYPAALDGKVATETKVGVYTLARDGTGWALFVTRFGPALEVDDPLFSGIYELSSALLRATD